MQQGDDLARQGTHQSLESADIILGRQVANQDVGVGLQIQIRHFERRWAALTSGLAMLAGDASRVVQQCGASEADDLGRIEWTCDKGRALMLAPGAQGEANGVNGANGEMWVHGLKGLCDASSSSVCG